MDKKKSAPQTIDEYIAAQPKNIQTILEQLRKAIKEAAPDAQETISYQMPAFKQDQVLVWFAAFKKHIGFYPTAKTIESFKEQLAPYQTSKGTVRFPLEKPIPLKLVKDMVRFRVKENLQR
jgi:uncharacterized protein YdhG (YjbR/CyaY superfamily)